MLLTPDQEMIRDAVRDFARQELWPHAAEWDKQHHFPKEAHKGLAALGAYGICVPEELGGAGLDYLTLALVLEEIAAGDGGVSTTISVTNCPVNAILMMYGNDAQKKQWLTPLAQGELLGAFCLTEPHVGSDASSLRTTAVKEGNEYVINGVKQFITSGKHGDVAIVIAVTDKGAGKKGMSAFLVPTSAPGYVVARLEDKLGQHSSDTAQINFDNCRVPAENLVGRDTLPEFLATLGRAAVLLTPDAGPAHMGAAVGTPVLGLYAATNPARSGPYFSRDWCVDRYAAAARQVLGKTVAELAWTTKIERPGVMDLITVEEVVERLDAVAAAGYPRTPTGGSAIIRA